MDVILLDNNCYQRSFDDQNQYKIFTETLACEQIFTLAAKNKVTLVWSFINEDEINLCPDVERKLETLRLSDLCKRELGPNKNILELARKLNKEDGFGPKDALYMACAINAKIKYFLTCDKKIIRLAAKKNYGLEVYNPIEYISRRWQ